MNAILDNWEVIRDEGLVQMKEGNINDFARPRNMDIDDADFNGWVRGWTDDPKWLNYGIVYNGKLLRQNGCKCPQTFNLLQKMMKSQKIIMAGYSWLKPKSGIPKHTDEWSDDIYEVYHIGLSIPDPDRCLLGVESNINKHRNGELICFDDKKPHWALNNTDKDRLILYIKCLK